MRCWGIYDTNLLAERERPPLQEALAGEMGLHGASFEGVEVKGIPSAGSAVQQTGRAARHPRR